MHTIRIATRNSPLALWQAEFVKQRLLRQHRNLVVEIVGMTTQGDQLLDRSLATAGGKGLFLKELEVSLLNGETDIAVHSMKDVPVKLPEGLEIPVVCEREDPRDAFVSNSYQNLYALPKGARVGTSSLRRTSQLQSAFPSLKFLPLRGNVNTRLGKLDNGDYEAIILASAGLIRLGFEERIKQRIPPELCLPAVGQGIVGIECRAGDDMVKELIDPLHDRESALLLTAERAMNKALDGGCQVPIAGFAEIVKGRVQMRGVVAAIDGSEMLYSNKLSENLDLNSASELGLKVGAELLDKGAARLLSAIIPKDPKVVNQPHKTILLTRQQRYRGNMRELLEQLQHRVECIETLQIDPQLNEDVATHIHNLATFSDILFVSRNAVEIGMALIQDEGLEIPEAVNVMAVGAETAKQLKSYGISALFPNKGKGAEALLEVSDLQNLDGRRILIIRGINGLTWPAEEMRKRGAHVVNANVYQQNLPSQGAEKFAALFERYSRVDTVFLHSAQSAVNFMQLARKYLHKFVGGCLIVGSDRVGEAAKQLGWMQDIKVANSPSNKDMLLAFAATQRPID